MFFVRPFCFDFLNELKDIYEIITFTAGTKEYADNILNQLDFNRNIFQYRLYRQHTTIVGNNVYKDLSKLGRELSKTIIIDNLRENFKLQNNNGIFIKTWTSDVNDTQFKDIKKILKDIVKYQVNDVRIVIGEDVLALIDITELAQTFNLEKERLMGKLVVMPTDIDYDDTKIVVYDKKAFVEATRLYQYLVDMASYNTGSGYINHNLKTDRLYGYIPLNKVAVIDISKAIETSKQDVLVEA